MRVMVALFATLAGSLVLTASRAEPQYGPDTCGPGYVWREAFSGDHVCVAPRTREQAASDNGQAEARREPGGGASGPETCRSGYVWREASPADHVCVTSETRAETAYDNSQAPLRRISDICRSGFVWREAFDGDHVCVPPATRDRARADNSQAEGRRQPGGGSSGPDTCRPGYVWREARPSDHVCVTPQTRDETARDNTPGLVRFRRFDAACDAYARRAMAQNAENHARNCGFGVRDNRWHDNYDDHYDWCLRADATARAQQVAYRDNALAGCATSNSGSTGGTQSGSQALIAVELPFGQGDASNRNLVITGSGFHPEEQVTIKLVTRVDRGNPAVGEVTTTADRLGFIRHTTSVYCVFGRHTEFEVSARGLSSGRTSNISGASC